MFDYGNVEIRNIVQIHDTYLLNGITHIISQNTVHFISLWFCRESTLSLLFFFLFFDAVTFFTFK